MAPHRGGWTGQWSFSPQMALTKAQAMLALVASSGLLWPLPPRGTEPGAPPSSGFCVCSHCWLWGARVVQAWATGEQRAQHSAQGCFISGSVFLASDVYAPLGAFFFLVICKWGERRTGCPVVKEGRVQTSGPQSLSHASGARVGPLLSLQVPCALPKGCCFADPFFTSFCSIRFVHS